MSYKLLGFFELIMNIFMNNTTTTRGTHLPYLSLQERVVCSHQKCSSILRDSCGHVTCRKHSPCRSIKGAFTIWHPSGCEICRGLLSRAFEDSSLSVLVQQESAGLLRKWIRGFSKINQREGHEKAPYLPTEALRALLFPRALKSSVFGGTRSPPP